MWELQGQPLPIVAVFDPAQLVHYIAAGLGVDHRGCAACRFGSNAETRRLVEKDVEAFFDGVASGHITGIGGRESFDIFKRWLSRSVALES